MNNKDEFMLFSYHATCDDWFGVDGARSYLERSNLTLDALRLYKEAGFNILFVSYVFGYNALEEEWEQTKTKRVMDMAHELDMKCIVFEWNLHRLTGASHSLIDAVQADGYGTFSSEQELENFVRNCLKGPMSHPAFFGVSVKDEPFHPMFKAQGEVYRAIKKVAPTAYVNMNILPYSPNFVLMEHRGFYSADEEEIGPFAAYQKYNESFYREVKPERLQYDDYPIHENDAGEKYIIPEHILNADVVSRFCVEKGIDFYKVFQTCAGSTSGKLWRKPTERDMYWQMNIGMAMGIKGFSYWTYFPTVNTAGEYYDETACFVNRFGEPNPIYFVMKKIHSEMQKAAKTLLKFDYLGMKIFNAEKLLGDTEFLSVVKQAIQKGETVEAKLLKIEEVNVFEKGALLVTELKNRENGELGYYLVNITDPATDTKISATVRFENETTVNVLDKGELYQKITNSGELTFDLDAGAGVFVVPQQ